MGALRGKLTDASQREADLLARYNSRHPAVANVQAEKRDIERSIAAETQRIVQALKSDYTLAKARLDATEQAMREATGQGGLNNEDSIKLRELERTAAVNKSFFEEFLQKAKVTAEQSTFQAHEVRIIVPAQKPGGPSFPNRQRALMAALLVGLGLGVAGALALEMLSTGFTTPRQVEELLGLPVLASVRRMEKGKLVKDGEMIPIPFYQLHYPLSPLSEAMRTLRSSIHMSDVDQPPKVIHVTSSKPGGGQINHRHEPRGLSCGLGHEGRPYRCGPSSPFRRHGLSILKTRRDSWTSCLGPQFCLKMRSGLSKGSKIDGSASGQQEPQSNRPAWIGADEAADFRA